MAENIPPIAIIGLSCRLPGGANNLDGFWQMLSERRSGWSDVPNDRYNWKSFHHPDPEMNGTTNHRGGHFLDQDIAAFDAGFFGISPMECASIDPQQRILLETAYEALEGAGISLESIRGSKTGVYTATFNHDYDSMMYKDTSDLPKYLMTGTGQALAANRLSYLFDLQGPSFALDTGCSGSMVALHQACQSLRLGESEMAFVGAANLMLTPEVMMPMSTLHVLNKDGKSYSFDSRGSGYGRGEGAATVILKRLDDALAARDPVRAIIRNTGCNQDGKTNGITLPNSRSQETLIRSTYRAVGLDPEETAFVEAHGTGTAVGDKAEIEAIGNVFGGRDADSPLYVGSVKGNIGHLENASGIAAIVKAVLVLEKGFIPPAVNLQELKSELRLGDRGIKVPQELQPWPATGLRRISVNSFGYGGTNAHAILELDPSGPFRQKDDAYKLENGGDHSLENGDARPEYTNQCGEATIAKGFTNGQALPKRHMTNGTNKTNEGKDMDTKGSSWNVDGEQNDAGTEQSTKAQGNLQANGTIQVNGFGKANAPIRKDGRTSVNEIRQLNGTTHLNGVNIANEVKANGEAREEKDKTPPTSQAERSAPRMFLLTAKSQNSLLESAKSLRQWLTTQSSSEDLLENLAYTLSLRRSIMQWRCSIVASTHQELEHALASKALRVSKAPSSAPPVAFLFTGQGAQYCGMARELLSTQSMFFESLQRSNKVLKRLGASWDLIEELLLDESRTRVDGAQIGQPATTAIQIGLVDLLRSLGIKPQMVLGHSSGEIAAAYAAGALTHESAMEVSYRRSFLAERAKRLLQSRGAMMAVGLGEREVTEKFPSRFLTKRISVACVNSPSSTTISGDHDTMVDLKHDLDSAAIFCRLLKIDTAYHSHHMRIVSEEYLNSLSNLQSSSTDPAVRFFSSVTGEEQTSGFEASYWVANLVSQVKYNSALEKLCQVQQADSPPGRTTIFIELGPHSALAGPFRQTMKEPSLATFAHRYVPSLVRKQDALQSILELVGTTFDYGCPTDLGAASRLAGSSTGKVISNLPSYSWEHSTTHWHESRLSKDYRLRQYPHHDLLGLRVVGSTPIEPSWRHIVSVTSLPWLRDHVVDGLMIFPASGYLCMAIEAMRQICDDSQSSSKVLSYVLKTISFSNALIIPEAPGTIELQMNFTTMVEKNIRTPFAQRDFLVVSISSGGACTEHCRGTIVVEVEQSMDEVEGLRESEHSNEALEELLSSVRRECSLQLDSRALYQELQQNGNFYGRSFGVIREISFGEKYALGTILVPDVAKCMPASFLQPHVIHPGTLDAFIHSTLPLYGRRCANGSVVTVGIEELKISSKINSKPGEELVVATTVLPDGATAARCQVSTFQMNDSYQMEPVVQMTNLALRGISKAASQLPFDRNMSYRIQWEVDVETIVEQAPEAINASGSLSPEQKLRLLDQAAVLYMRACLEQVTDEGALGEPRVERVAFYQWMKRFCESEQGQNLVSGLSDVESEALLERAQAEGVEGQMLCRVGSQFEPIITGRLDPLAVMLEDDLLYRLYGDDSSSRCYAHMINYLKALTFKDPGMTVLEIGGGTGGATKPLLQALDNDGTLPLGRYDFTDVSSGFFEKAREKFGRWERYLQFKTLDIMDNPIEQGFEQGSYDVIIASNVLHVPLHVDRTIAYARSLLKPGGRLVMIETIRVVPFYNALCGVLPGWFIGINHGRPDSPLLTVEQWSNYLKQGSFSGIDVASYDYDGPARRSAMMVSRAIEQEPSRSYSSVNMILDQKVASRHAALIEQLHSNFKSCGLSSSSTSWPSSDTITNGVYFVIDDGTNPILSDISTDAFHDITNLLTKGRQIFWLTLRKDRPATTNLERSLVVGVARTARVENESLDLVTLDAEYDLAHSTDLSQRISELVTKSFGNSTSEDPKEYEYAYCNGKLLIPRLMSNANTNELLQAVNGRPEKETSTFRQRERPLRLLVEAPGSLDSMCFVDDTSLQKPLSPHEIEVEVQACGVNFKDLMIALGQINSSVGMAGEYAGVVVGVGSDFQTSFRVGDRVCGYLGTPYASQIRVNGHLVSLLPQSIPITVGASIPVVFATAYYGLIEIGRLEAGQTVLIHAASGGVGQAAIRISQHIGAEIFATVGSASKKKLLMDKFGIPESHIFSSRLRTFKEGVLRLTKGTGVDVILNSLSGDSLKDTWACVAKFGTFVEIGKTDIYAKSRLSMEPFDKNVTFASLDLAILSKERPEKVGRVLQKVMAMFESGALKPVTPVTVMPITEIEDAFRQMQARKHVGKLVLEVKDDTMVKAVRASAETLRLSEDGTYVIAGGLGGLGLEICRYLAKHGAKHVVLLSRRTLSPQKQRALEKEFDALGTTVRVARCDITIQEDVDALASSLADLPPVRGVIQSAMVLQDRLLQDMTSTDFSLPLRTKLTGTKHLLAAFSTPSLQTFTLLSSVVSITGNPAQANYGAANAFLDAVAHSHSAPQSPAPNAHFTSLNLGPMKDVGVVAANPKLEQFLIRRGYLPVTLAEFFAVLSYALRLSGARADDRRQIVLGFTRASLESSEGAALLRRNAMFAHLPRSASARTEAARAVAVQQTLEDRLADAKSPGEKREVVAQALARKVAALLAMDVAEVDLEVPVRELGLDSLVLIELKHWVSEGFGRVLQSAEIEGAGSLRGLAGLVGGEGR